MSGQCTGWVLRHGPKERAMRLVLVTIADAANRDGEHAHPGVAAICEGSLYSRARVKTILRRLVDEGWLEIEEQGGGRGLATVYNVVMDRSSQEEKGQPVAPFEQGKGLTPEEKGPIPNAKGANPEREKGQFRDPSPSYTTVSTTELPNARDRVDEVSPVLFADLEQERGKGRDYGFEKLLDLWPRRRGRKVGREPARAQWTKFTYAEKSSAYQAAKHYAAECGEYPKDAVRWLSDRCWEEWVDPPAPTARSGPITATDAYNDELEREWLASNGNGKR